MILLSIETKPQKEITLSEFIYRYIDGKEICYVGITNNVTTRYSVHLSSSHWCNSGLTYEICEMPDRSTAKMLETYLIKKLSPKNNTAENNGADVGFLRLDEAKIQWVNYFDYIKTQKAEQETSIEKTKTQKTKKNKKQTDVDFLDSECEEKRKAFLLMLRNNKHHKELSYRTEYGNIRVEFGSGLAYKDLKDKLQCTIMTKRTIINVLEGYMYDCDSETLRMTFCDCCDFDGLAGKVYDETMVEIKTILGLDRI